MYAKLTEIWRDVLDDDLLEVTPQLSAKDVEGWDSLNHIRLMLTVEKCFNVKLSVSEIAGMQQVADLVALIQASASKVEGKP
jgi:acyl carrier protein